MNTVMMMMMMICRMHDDDDLQNASKIVWRMETVILLATLFLLLLTLNRSLFKSIKVIFCFVFVSYIEILKQFSPLSTCDFSIKIDLISFHLAFYLY